MRSSDSRKIVRTGATTPSRRTGTNAAKPSTPTASSNTLPKDAAPQYCARSRNVDHVGYVHRGLYRDSGKAGPGACDDRQGPNSGISV